MSNSYRAAYLTRIKSQNWENALTKFQNYTDDINVVAVAVMSYRLKTQLWNFENEIAFFEKSKFHKLMENKQQFKPADKDDRNKAEMNVLYENITFATHIAYHNHIMSMCWWSNKVCDTAD